MILLECTGIDNCCHRMCLTLQISGVQRWIRVLALKLSARVLSILDWCVMMEVTGGILI